MSSRRLRSRVPSARFVAVASLSGHELRCHKLSRDGSGKCDAFETGHGNHRVIGVVFDIPEDEKPELDRKEGLGCGYEEKKVGLVTTDGANLEAITYYATVIDTSVKPYHWYKEHVLIGANEHGLPGRYIEIIATIASMADPESGRHEQELSIYVEK